MRHADRGLAGRDVTTLEGLDDATRARWVDAFTATGASQCGFCTPGIIMRLSALDRHDEATVGRGAARAPLSMHRLADDLRSRGSDRPRAVA